MMKKIKDYAKRLCEEDAKIEEIVLIGSFANGTATNKSDIDLVCVFGEKFFVPKGQNSIIQGYKHIKELRTKMEEFEKHLELGHQVDLGFMHDGPPIFLGGLISNYEGKYITLAKQSEVNHEQ